MLYIGVEILTIILSGADLAASAGQEDGVGAGGLGALRLDVLAANPANYSAFFVNLKYAACSVYSY